MNFADLIFEEDKNLCDPRLLVHWLRSVYVLVALLRESHLRKKKIRPTSKRGYLYFQFRAIVATRLQDTKTKQINTYYKTINSNIKAAVTNGQRNIKMHCISYISDS